MGTAHYRPKSELAEALESQISLAVSECWQGLFGPHFERSLCFSVYNVIRRAYMNLHRPCGACGEPDTKNSIQAGLRQHDVIPGRYKVIEHAVQVVERFKS